jgi:diacylglycerol O-acyltransferase / wax synthase
LGEPVDNHISSVDAFTLTLERDPLLRATIVAVAAFDRAPDWSTLTERIDRATRLIPRFRQKLVTVPLGLAPPRWIVDPDFDLSLHLHRLRVQRGGDMSAVLDFARNASLTAFDHDRPLWEFTLLEGLAERRAALVMKLHHALTDGVGGIQIAAHVVDLERKPSKMGPMPAAPVPTRHGMVDTVSDTVGHYRRRVSDASHDLRRLAPRAAKYAVTHPANAVRNSVDTALAVARFVRPVTRTRSPIMVERRPLREPSTLDVSLSDLQTSAHQVGSTLNDAFLAGVAGGMRLYHERHMAIVDHLLISMPINVRAPGDAPGGNRVTLARFDLPVGITDPGRRMRAISERTTALRRDPAIPYAGAIAGVLNLLPVDVTAGMLKNVDLLASNVPGFGQEVFVGGALLESFHVLGATLGSAANITLMSYRDTCHIGINADAGAVRDPELLHDCIVEVFDEVTSWKARSGRSRT